jgi:hypothetical protein
MATPDAPPLLARSIFGRARELDALDGVLTGRANPPAMSFAGEAGIGKTRLARWAASAASERGWAVMVGGRTSGFRNRSARSGTRSAPACVRDWRRPATIPSRGDSRGCSCQSWAGSRPGRRPTRGRCFEATMRHLPGWGTSSLRSWSRTSPAMRDLRAKRFSAHRRCLDVRLRGGHGRGDQRVPPRPRGVRVLR